MYLNAQFSAPPDEDCRFEIALQVGGHNLERRVDNLLDHVEGNPGIIKI
jgi:hypothetical protein